MSVVVANLLESKGLLQNYFDFFGLPKHFKIDLAELEQCYLKVQQEVHPDRHATSGAAQKRAALQLATYTNTAYETLKNPIKRGLYLCELAGLDPKLETNTSMPKDFLMQQMQWREELDDADEDVLAIEGLLKQVVQEKKRSLQVIADLLDDQHDQVAALEKLRAALFMDRFDIKNSG